MVDLVNGLNEQEIGIFQETDIGDQLFQFGKVKIKVKKFVLVL
jgi:hypothetical protein